MISINISELEGGFNLEVKPINMAMVLRAKPSCTLYK